MDYANPDGIVSTEWLASQLGAPDLKVIDASWWPENAKRDAKEEYLECHIAGAVFFDIDDICDHGTDLPHMLPSADLFGAKVGALGIGNGDRIVVYDNVGGGGAAARVWWMFRVFGHEKVAVLSGGFPKWLREQRDIEEDTVPKPRPAVFVPGYDAHFLRRLDDLAADVATHQEQIVDGRKAERFRARQEELPEGARAGHIPGSINLPAAELLDTRELTILPAERLRAKFQQAGIDLTKPVVATCGEGVTCCLLTLGMYLIGKTDVANYDGSWVEWAAHPELPVEYD